MALLSRLNLLSAQSYAATTPVDEVDTGDTLAAPTHSHRISPSQAHDGCGSYVLLLPPTHCDGMFANALMLMMLFSDAAGPSDVDPDPIRMERSVR